MPYKILFIDDEVEFSDIMSKRIESWGYSVVCALDAKKAIEIINKENFDIIILDYKLTDIDGISLLKRIRKINKKVSVVMFTAYPDEKVMKSADKLGISSFVPKMNISTDDQTELLKTSLGMIAKKGVKNSAE